MFRTEMHAGRADAKVSAPETAFQVMEFSAPLNGEDKAESLRGFKLLPATVVTLGLSKLITSE